MNKKAGLRWHREADCWGVNAMRKIADGADTRDGAARCRWLTVAARS